MMLSIFKFIDSASQRLPLTKIDYMFDDEPRAFTILTHGDSKSESSIFRKNTGKYYKINQE